MEKFNTSNKLLMFAKELSGLITYYGKDEFEEKEPYKIKKIDEFLKAQINFPVDVESIKEYEYFDKKDIKLLYKRWLSIQRRS